MVWLIIIAVSVIVAVITLPTNKSSYPLLDDKPKKHKH